MDIENGLKALRLLRSRLVWISNRVGIVLVTKATYRASTKNLAHDKTKCIAHVGEQQSLIPSNK